MRYFKTTNASRRYVAGGLAFIFEPAENIGGSWSGLLAVEDNSAASKLVEAAIPQVSEITKEEYEGLKKKPQTPNPNFRDSVTQPQSSQPLRVAGRAGRVESTSSSNPPSTPAPAPSVSLKSARIDVPDELKLETGTPKKRSK